MTACARVTYYDYLTTPYGPKRKKCAYLPNVRLPKPPGIQSTPLEVRAALAMV